MTKTGKIESKSEKIDLTSSPSIKESTKVTKKTKKPAASKQNTTKPSALNKIADSSLTGPVFVVGSGDCAQLGLGYENFILLTNHSLQ
jgi:hypothetical protein